MKSVYLTLKNYRGFSDSEPLRLELGTGFTAIVGPNNSGKSAIKLFFYELRQLFSSLSQAPGVQPGINNVFLSAPIPVSYQGVSDNAEIFYNDNTRPMEIEIDILDPTHSEMQPGIECLKRVVGVCDRLAPTAWHFKAFGNNNPRVEISAPQVPGATSPYTLRWPNGPLLDFKIFQDTMNILANARYYGPFRNAINQGAGDHFDLKVGTAFVNLWSDWKTTGIRSQMRAIDAITEDIRRLFEFERLEINASEKLKTLMVSIDGRPYRLNELGSGLAQFIMVLGNAATNPPSLLLIDEPETNLHPSLQIDFLMSLAGYAKNGVVFSTHLIGLARSVADRIYSIQKRGDRTIVRPFEATPNYLEFVGELSFSAFKELGSDKLLLVEGVNDVKSVQQLLRLVKKEHTTVILPLGGDQLARGGREAELNELTRLSDHIYALVDSERDSLSAPPAGRRVGFAETCHKIGIDVCVTERRAIENYFSERAIKAALGDAFTALSPYQVLKDAALPWGKVDNWKIAREMTIEELAGTDLGKFLQRL